MTERKPADSAPDTWASLHGTLKGKGNGARLTIEEMNDVIANSWTAAGLAGLIPDEEIDRWVASWGTDQALPVPDIAPDNLHGKLILSPPVGRETPGHGE